MSSVTQVWLAGDAECCAPGRRPVPGGVDGARDSAIAPRVQQPAADLARERGLVAAGGPGPPDRGHRAVPRPGTGADRALDRDRDPRCLAEREAGEDRGPGVRALAATARRQLGGAGELVRADVATRCAVAAAVRDERVPG